MDRRRRRRCVTGMPKSNHGNMEKQAAIVRAEGGRRKEADRLHAGMAVVSESKRQA